MPTEKKHLETEICEHMVNGEFWVKNLDLGRDPMNLLSIDFLNTQENHVLRYLAHLGTTYYRFTELTFCWLLVTLSLKTKAKKTKKK